MEIKGGIVLILANKIRLKPTKEQENKLWQSAGTARFIYNWTLQKQEENYKNGGKFIENGELRKQITQLKKVELAWLNQISNNVAKQAVKDACTAYKRFFKGVSNKPKFKSKKKSKIAFYNTNDKIRIKDNCVLLEKIGWVRTAEQISPNVKYYNPRVSFDGKYWYLSIGIDKDIGLYALSNESIGIDVGIKELAVCSNGMVSENINKSIKIKKMEKRLRRLQRSISRKYEYNKTGKQFVKTNNLIKLERQLKLLHRKLTNIRTNHLHHESSKIVKTKPSTIIMEDLNIKGMMKNKYLSKAIAKQGMYKFTKQIEYKCAKYGIKFIKADRWYPSSKICSDCGFVKNNLPLSERTYKCENCLLEIDRDFNAAKNLSKYTLIG